MKKWICLLVGLVSLLASAQPFSVNWTKTAGGGGRSTGSGFTVTGTFGQHDAGGPLVGDGFTAFGGFWSPLGKVPPASLSTSLATLNLSSNIYGTASSALQCTVTGTSLYGGITVTATNGVEVSLDGNTYNPTATMTSFGGTLYVRLSATAGAGTYTAQNVVLSNAAAKVTLLVNGLVAPKSLNITAPTVTKVYDGTTAPGTVTVGVISGFVGTETVTATGTATAYAGSNVASNYSTIVSYTLANGLNGGKAANYTMASSAIVNAAITKRSLTITASNVTKFFGATLNAALGYTAFTSSGLVSPETIGSVTVNYGSGAAAAAAVGNYPGQVTPSAATGGTFAPGNYNISYVAGDLAVVTATVAATYTTGSEVPVTANGYTATGKTVGFTLNHVPTVGEELMVVRNTALDFINGNFDNLAQGQVVELTFGGNFYKFVANYFGGSGNDLVLVWANTRVVAWGNNVYSQLGSSYAAVNNCVPVAVDTGAGSALNGKTVIAVAAGLYHSLALCSDGTVAAWGYGSSGQLGNGSTGSSYIPVAVTTASGSALAGKRVVAIAAGFDHSVALCSDGTVAVWGSGGFGQLGNGSTVNSSIPVAVNMGAGSALAGKKVVAIAAGNGHSVALCPDGTVVAWGYGGYGQLGNGSTANSLVPVAVNTAAGSALAGKKVMAIAAGCFNTFALSDAGAVAAWGSGGSGELGNGSTVNSSISVAVNTGAGSALAGKTVVAIAAGHGHSLALCEGGTVATWGYGGSGQLGNGSSGGSLLPVSVTTASGSVLAGKVVVAIATGHNHSFVLCEDGVVAAWGSGGSGQLGNNSFMNSSLPVGVSRSTLGVSDRLVGGIRSGKGDHSLSLVASGGYTITATAGANGLVTPAGATVVNYKANKTYAITPNAGYHVADVQVDGVSVGAPTSYTFSSVTAGHTISATFAPDQAPADIFLSSSNVAESQPSGTLVGTLSCPNVAVASATYSLVSGTGSTDNSSFSITGNSLKTAAVFNYPTKNSYSIRVRITDNFGATFEKAFTISVIDSTVVAPGGQIVVTSGGQLGGAPLVITSGSFVAGGTGPLALTTPVSFAGSNTVSGNAVTISAPVTLADNSTINVSNTTVTINGPLTETTPGSGFTKTGNGTLVLNGDISNVGTITITAGTIIVNGSGGSTCFTVAGAATLGGNGAVGCITLQPGSKISPGRSPGSLDAGDTVWTGGSSFDWQINDANGTSGNDPGWDAVNITGTLTLTATPGDKFNFNVQTLDPANDPGDMVNFDNNQPYAWTVATATGGIIGFDASAINLDTGSFSNATAGGTFALVTNATALMLTFTPTNLPPTDISLSGSNVFENLPGGTTVGVLSATDPDAGDAATYTLVGGPGGDDNAYFDIVGANLQSVTPFDYETRTNFSIRVQVRDGGNRTFEKVFAITVGNVTEPASIETQPQSQTNSAGSSVSFSVVASGDQPLHYQWRTNGVDIADANAASYTIDSVKVADQLNYTVVVTNDYGSVTSSVATLTVDCPLITLTPTNLPAGHHWEVYSQTLTATGGCAPYAFSVSGTLPPGLTFSGAGVLTGTPASGGYGNYNFIVTATDTNGCSGTGSYTVAVTPVAELRIISSGGGGWRGAATRYGTPDNGAALVTNKSYVLTALPQANYIFSNWLASANGGAPREVSRVPLLNFVMEPDLVLFANFVTNRFPASGSTYYGLFQVTNQPLPTIGSAGFFTLKTTKRATTKPPVFSGKLVFNGITQRIAGAFDVAGLAFWTGSPVPGVTMTLTMQENYDDTITGTVTARAGAAFWSADLQADRAVFDAASNPATNYSGQYTMLMGEHPAFSGCGFGTFSVSDGGAVKPLPTGRFGYFGDGQRLKPCATGVSKTGLIPFYVPPVESPTSVQLIGWLQITNTPARLIDGELTWMQATNSSTLAVEGSGYNPATGISMTNGLVYFRDGHLAAPTTNAVTIINSNSFSVSPTTTGGAANQVLLRFQSDSGTVSGALPRPADFIHAPQIKGVYLQNQNYFGGFFLGATNSGAFRLQAR